LFFKDIFQSYLKTSRKRADSKWPKLAGPVLAHCVSCSLGTRKKKKEVKRTMDRLRLKGEEGFTLIELLVVIAIIGILAAIAIPQFAAYRRRGFEATAKADLRNAATAQEAYFVTKNAYLSGAITSQNPPGYNKSAAITMTSATGTGTFLLTATHANCAAVNWTYDSLTGVPSNTTCPP